MTRIARLFGIGVAGLMVGARAIPVGAQDSPVQLRLDGLGLQVHKVVDGADWLIEELFANNSVTGLVRHSNGATDFLSCSRTGYDDQAIEYRCFIAQSDGEFVALPAPVVLPAAFFRPSGSGAVGRFPPSLDRFPITEGNLLALAITHRDGSDVYVAEGPVETLDGGRQRLRMIEQGAGSPATLETTTNADGVGLTNFDYRLTVPGDGECSIDLFNISQDDRLATGRRLLMGVRLQLETAPDGSCPDPFGSAISNEAAGQIVGRTLASSPAR